MNLWDGSIKSKSADIFVKKSCAARVFFSICVSFNLHTRSSSRSVSFRVSLVLSVLSFFPRGFDKKRRTMHTRTKTKSSKILFVVLTVLLSLTGVVAFCIWYFRTRTPKLANDPTEEDEEDEAHGHKNPDSVIVPLSTPTSTQVVSNVKSDKSDRSRISDEKHHLVITSPKAYQKALQQEFERTEKTSWRRKKQDQMDYALAQMKEECIEKMNTIKSMRSCRDNDTAHGNRLKKQEPINIAMFAVGTMGDINPMLAVADELSRYGHHVTFGTHECFRKLIESHSLIFKDLGGDPAILMEFVVRNRGRFLSVGYNGFTKDVPYQRAFFTEQLSRGLEICNENMREGYPPQAIVTNAVCAVHVHLAEAFNLPLHVYSPFPWTPSAEIPHMFSSLVGSLRFDLPDIEKPTTTTATTAITTTNTNNTTSSIEQKPETKNMAPTKLPSSSSSSSSNIISNKTAVERLRNRMSHSVIDRLVFTGLLDIFNRFRTEQCLLPPLRWTCDTQLMYKRKARVSYLWSPSMFPKPWDWGEHIDIVGYHFTTDPTKQPAQTQTHSVDIADVADEQKKPPTTNLILTGVQKFADESRRNGHFVLFVGFGSCVFKRDMSKLVSFLQKAAECANCNLILQSNWTSFSSSKGGKQQEEEEEQQEASEYGEERIMFIGQAPHEKLFPLVDAVCHHGGSGTSASGFRHGKPSIIVPFFGDQFFWANWIHQHGLGCKPIPFIELTIHKLIRAFRFIQNPRILRRCRIFAEILTIERAVLTPHTPEPSNATIHAGSAGETEPTRISLSASVISFHRTLELFHKESK